MGFALFATGLALVLVAASIASLPMAIVGCAALIAATTWLREEDE